MKNLMKAKELIKRNPWLSVNSLRHLTNNRSKNGLDSAIIYIGRNIFYDEDLFDAWVGSKKNK